MFKSLKTFVLLAALSGLLLYLGQLFGGSAGLWVAFGIALLMNGISYFKSDKIALRMARAVEADPREYPQYHAMVQNLSQRIGQPMPRLYVSPSPQPNAFATGRNPKHAAVCINDGLFRLLDNDELEAVLAHELSHVYNRDILIGSVAATIATAITFLARFAFFMPRSGDDDNGGGMGGLLMLFLAPVAAMVIQLAVTRSRETQADTSGAELSGNPLALARALQKIEVGGRRGLTQAVTPAEASPAFSQLYISAPLGGALTRSFGSLFRTHPSTEERVANLHEIARKMGQIA